MQRGVLSRLKQHCGAQFSKPGLVDLPLQRCPKHYCPTQQFHKMWWKSKRFQRDVFDTYIDGIVRALQMASLLSNANISPF